MGMKVVWEDTVLRESHSELLSARKSGRDSQLARGRHVVEMEKLPKLDLGLAPNTCVAINSGHMGSRCHV
jgi:hypothetical protein